MNNVEKEAHVIEEKNCVDCGGLITPESRFCKFCGASQNSLDIQRSELKWPNVQQVALFFIFDAVICAIASFIIFFKTLAWSVTFDCLLAIITVVFFCDSWSNIKSILNWPNFSILKLLYYCTLAVICSLCVSYTVNWINQSLFSEQFSYYAFYQDHKYAKELTIFFVAIMPALFEELGYRGFVLEKLLQVVDKKQAIFITSFLFAIMHMSFISLFWLLPFALLLAYIRIKENTLWYGVLMHFSFNLTVCVLEINYVYR